MIICRFQLQTTRDNIVFVDDDRANFPLQAVNMATGHAKFDHFGLELIAQPPIAQNVTQFVFPAGAGKDMLGLEPSDMSEISAFVCGEGGGGAAAVSK